MRSSRPGPQWARLLRGPAALLAAGLLAAMAKPALAEPAPGDPDSRRQGLDTRATGAPKVSATSDPASGSAAPSGSGTSPADEPRSASRGRPAPPARRLPGPRVDDPGVDLAIRRVLREARTGQPVEPPDTPHGARFRVYYRGYEFTCGEGHPCFYHGVGLIFYPTAFLDVTGFWRYFRFGIGLAGMGEDEQERTHWWQHNFSLEALLTVGFQYPWHLTPYAELIVGLGALHQNIYNKDFIDFSYSFGLDFGLEWFVAGHFNIGAAVGWRRSIVSFGSSSRYLDSVTFQVGLGL